MKEFRGKLTDFNGTAVLDGVAGQFKQPLGAATPDRWFGHFALPAGKPIRTGDYRLVLDDGRSTAIAVQYTVRLLVSGPGWVPCFRGPVRRSADHPAFAGPRKHATPRRTRQRQPDRVQEIAVVDGVANFRVLSDWQ